MNTRKEQIENRIIKASINECIAKGVISASMENIAKLADVSKRTLYKYFPNKEAIFDTIIEDLLNSISKVVDVKYDPNIEIEQQLQVYIDNKMAFVLSDDYLNISKLVLSELLKSRPLKEEHLIRFSEIEQRFITWIEEAREDGKIKSELPASTIADQFHSLMKGQTYWPVLLGLKKLSKDEVDQISNESLKFFINSFC